MKKFGMALVYLLFLTGLGWAGNQTSNGFFYKPSLGARGQAECDTFNAGLDRVDARLAKETWLGDPGGSPGYDTLVNAITTAGKNTVILRIPAGSVVITANLTVPANITLQPERGAVFAIADGTTLTINGPLQSGLYQIFSCSGSGKVVFGPGSVKEVFPQWWGAKADDLTFDQTPMFQFAISSLGSAGGIVSYPPGRYAVNLVIDAYNITLNGPSQTTTSNSPNWLTPWDITKPVLQIANDDKYLQGGGVNNVTLYGVGPNGTGQLGLKLAGGTYQWNANNLSVVGFADKGIYGISGATYSISYVNFNNLTVMSAPGSYNADIYLDYGPTWLTAIYINNFNVSSSATGKALVLDGVQLGLSNGWIQVASSGNGIQFKKSGATSPLIYAANVQAECVGGGVVVETYNTSQTISSWVQGSMVLYGTLKLSNGSTVSIPSQFYAPYLSEFSYPKLMSAYICDASKPADVNARLVRSAGSYVSFINDAGGQTIKMSDGGVTSVGGGNLFQITGLPLRLTPLTAAPTSNLAVGFIALADRTNWDPLAKGGGGPYLVWYNGSAWVGLDSQ